MKESRHSFHDVSKEETKNYAPEAPGEKKSFESSVPAAPAPAPGYLATSELDTLPFWLPILHELLKAACLAVKEKKRIGKWERYFSYL